MLQHGTFLLGFLALQGGATPALESLPRAGVVSDGSLTRFEKQRVAFRVPLGWQRLTVVGKASEGLLATFAPLTGSGATLAFSYADDPKRQRLPDTLPATIAAALGRRYAGFQQLGHQRVTVAGADAWVLDGQLRQAGQLGMVRNRQVYICNEGRVYILTLTAQSEDFSRLAPSLERLLKSFTWLP